MIQQTWRGKLQANPFQLISSPHRWCVIVYGPFCLFVLFVFWSGRWHCQQLFFSLHSPAAHFRRHCPSASGCAVLSVLMSDSLPSSPPPPPPHAACDPAAAMAGMDSRVAPAAAAAAAVGSPIDPYYGDGEQPPSSPHPTVGVKAKTSRYDFVKVRIWRSEIDSNTRTNAINNSTDPTTTSTGRLHYHVLSRYLVARSLTTAMIPKSSAIRISLQCKKRLVDSGRLDITVKEWQRVLMEVVEEEERNGTLLTYQPTTITNHNDQQNIQRYTPQRFKMIQW